MNVRSFKAIVEYDGTDFAGFQWQHGERTVQGELEAAIAARTEQSVRITGAGRTDAGVHALGQVISFSAVSSIPTEKMALALNSVLPKDVVVRYVEECDETFSARFSASSRVYGYLILNRGAPSALLRRYSAFVPERLDVEAMRDAAKRLLGENDFAAFANELEPGKPTHRNVISCRVRRRNDLIYVRIEASAFLRGMVRTIVGTLIEIGHGRRSSEDITRLIECGNRREAGFSAPPQGLCLLRVRYGERIEYGRRGSHVRAAGAEET